MPVLTKLSKLVNTKCAGSLYKRSGVFSLKINKIGCGVDKASYFGNLTKEVVLEDVGIMKKRILLVVLILLIVAGAAIYLMRDDHMAQYNSVNA